MPRKNKDKSKAADATEPEVAAADPAVEVEAAPAPAPVVSAYRVDAHLLPPEQWGTEGDERAVVCVEAVSPVEAVQAAQADLAFVPAACLVHGPSGSTVVA